MLPDGWKNVTLDEITREQLVGTPLRGSSSDSTLPLLKMGNLLWGALDLRNVELIDEAIVEGQGCRVRNGDILFNTRNTPELVGKTAYWHAPYEAAFDNNIMRIRLRPNADPAYVAAWMGSQIGRKAIGQFVCASTSVGAVYWRDLCKMILPLPPLPEQRRIAAVLDAWDTAISLGERLVAAKRDAFGGLIHKLIDCSDAHKFELSDFATLVSSKVDAQRAPFKFSIELENIESGTGRLLGATDASGLLGQRTHFKPDDVLFAKLRPYLRKFWFADEEGMASTETWVLRADAHRCLPRYLYFLIRSHAFLGEANRPTGSRMPRADWGWVQSTPLPLPGTNEQGRIADLLTLAEGRWAIMQEHCTALRQQKRGLMQVSLTGKRRVPASIDHLLPDNLAALVAAE